MLQWLFSVIVWLKVKPERGPKEDSVSQSCQRKVTTLLVTPVHEGKEPLHGKLSDLDFTPMLIRLRPFY